MDWDERLAMETDITAQKTELSKSAKSLFRWEPWLVLNIKKQKLIGYL